MFGITFTFIFLHRWYTNIYRIFNPKISPVSKLVLFLIPFLCFFIIFFAIVLHASFDVVTNQFYIALYTVLGFAWIHFGVKMLFFLFDLSVVDDVLHSGNKAALFPAAGGIAGLTLIYAGANIGDGPGFWCVFFCGRTRDYSLDFVDITHKSHHADLGSHLDRKGYRQRNQIWRLPGGFGPHPCPGFRRRLVRVFPDDYGFCWWVGHPAAHHCLYPHWTLLQIQVGKGWSEPEETEFDLVVSLTDRHGDHRLDLYRTAIQRKPLLRMMMIYD